MKILNKNITIENISGIKIVDNFFTNECLEALKHRMLYAKYFDKKYNGYVAIDYLPTKDYLTDLIVSKIKDKFEVPEFQRAWSFLYAKNDDGVQLHCDPSILNLNVWVSSNESVLDPEKNGLHIYKVQPPGNWSRDDWNNNPDKSLEYIKSKNVQPVKITYKSNRAVLFDGSYFHKTNGVSMKEGYENMRISYTYLFGKNLE